jgi:hypothetical protein
VPNWLPYLALVLASVAVFVFALYRVRDQKLAALYLTMAGAAYLFELVILVLFDSYRYYPGLLANPYLDSLVGAVASNAFVVPAAAVAAAAFRLRPPGLLLVVAAIVAIEESFLALGIYRHNWWHTGYTAFFLLAGFVLARLWHSLLRQQPPRRFVCFATAFFAALFLRASAAFLLRILGLVFFSVGWFALPERGHIAAYSFFILAEAAVCAPIACGCGGRLLPPAALAAFFLVLVGLAPAGILLAPWWFPVLHLVISAAIFCLNRAAMAWLGLAASGG